MSESTEKKKETRPERPDRPGKPRAAGKPAGRRPGGAGRAAEGGKPRGGFGKPAGRRSEGNGAAEGGRPRGGFGKPAGRRPEGNGAAEGGKPRGGFGKPAGRRPEGSGAAEGGRPRGGFGKPTGRRPGAGHPGGEGRRAPGGKPAAQARPAEMEGLAARRAALKVLRQVTEEGAYASLSLDRELTAGGLKGVDRRLAARLVYDTLDRMIYLDHMLSQVMAREDTDLRLRNILRLGACQILIEDRIPESAATNTSVQLCTENGLEGLKGVCNGILRNLIRKKEELTLPDPETEPGRYFAVKHSVPEWLGERLRKDWGEEEAERIAAFRNTDGAITIRRNLLRGDEDSFRALLEKKVWGREPGELPGTWRITGAMDIARDADFLAGEFSIQSESSMMACLAVGVKRGMQVLDCCAAPGGKSCYLSELMGDTGRVQAWDLHEHRAALIAAQKKRLGLENIRPIQRDASMPREDLRETMDAVLLDAPCSGLGVMAEKPDIKLRVTEESVRELTELQAKLLDTVCAYVRPGGVLVYSTCSLLKDENEHQIRSFLEKHPEYTAESLPETIPEKFRKQENLGLQLMPHRDGVEGFYICRLRRRADF